MRRACFVVVGVYAVLCLLSLVVVPLSAIGALGIERDPLAAAFAILLALPWSMLLDWVPGSDSAAVNLAVLAVGMIVNVALLLAICRFARQAR